jgi:predicted patatin/cPLA2 family phospholipase
MPHLPLPGVRTELVVKNIRARARNGATDDRKIALIVEGGAMRGVFSSGANIGIESLGLLHAFDEVYGCSAGAINAAYLLAGQAAFGTRIYFEDINNTRFINLWRGPNRVIDLDYLFHDVIARRKRLDLAKIDAQSCCLLVSLTDAVTGRGILVDYRPGKYPLLDVIRASATHPLLSERWMRIGEGKYFDGGFADSLPVQAAIDRGCTDILALLTRPPDYVDPPPNLFLRELFRWRCAWGKPELVAAGREIHTRENRSRDLIFGRAALPANVNIAAICPTLDDGLGLLVKDEAVLRAAAQSAKRNVVEAFFDGNS